MTLRDVTFSFYTFKMVRTTLGKCASSDPTCSASTETKTAGVVSNFKNGNVGRYHFIQAAIDIDI